MENSCDFFSPLKSRSARPDGLSRKAKNLGESTRPSRPGGGVFPDVRGRGGEREKKMLSLGETRTEKTHTTTDNTHQPTITTARAASSHTTHARLPPSLFSSPSRARRRTTSHGDDDDGEAKRQRRGEVGADGVRGGGRFARAVTQNRRRRRRRHHRHPRIVEVTRSVLVKKTTFSTLHTQTTSRGSLQNKRAMLLCAKRVRSMLSHLVKRFHLSNAFLYVFGPEN